MLEAAYRLFDKRAIAPNTPVYLSPKELGVTQGTWEGKPSIAAQTLGLELRWSRAFTLTVGNIDGMVIDYEFYKGAVPPVEPVVKRLDDNHYTVTTPYHVIFPKGFNGLILPHPRYYEPVPENAYSDSPAVVPCVVEMDMDPRPLTIVCRLPRLNTYHNFYSGEPFCQIIPTPRGDVAISPMTEFESDLWRDREESGRYSEFNGEGW